MKRNNSKTDILLKAILGLGILGMLVVGYFLVSNFLEDRFTRLEDYKYDCTLIPGFYEVGVNLPAGTYVVQLEAQEAELVIYKQEDSGIYFLRKYYVYGNEKGEKAVLKLPYGGIGISGVRKVPLKKRVKNITLEEGQLLYVAPETEFFLYTNEIEHSSFESIEITNPEVPVVSSTSMAGEDFPAGVYDIVYIPKDSNQVGTIKYSIKDFMGVSIDCEGKKGAQVIARGIPFTPGSTLYIGNLDEITLVPKQKIGEVLNSLTWEAENN